MLTMLLAALLTGELTLAAKHHGSGVVAPPTGTRWVGIGHAAIAVPLSYATDTVTCGTVTRGAGQVLSCGGTHEHPIAISIGPTADARTCDTTTCSRADLAAQQVSFVVTGADRSAADELLGRVRVLPHQVAVPSYDDLDPAGYAAALHDVGLDADPVTFLLAGEPTPHHVVATAPDPATMLPVGDEVRVLERDVDRLDTVRLGYDGFAGRQLDFGSVLDGDIDMPVGGILDLTTGPISSDYETGIQLDGPVEQLGTRTWRVTGPGTADLVAADFCTGRPCTPPLVAQVKVHVTATAPPAPPPVDLASELSVVTNGGRAQARGYTGDRIAGALTLHLAIGDTLMLRLSDHEERRLRVDQTGTLHRLGDDWRATASGTTTLLASTTTCSPVVPACHGNPVQLATITVVVARRR